MEDTTKFDFNRSLIGEKNKDKNRILISQKDKERSNLLHSSLEIQLRDSLLPEGSRNWSEISDNRFVGRPFVKVSNMIDGNIHDHHTSNNLIIYLLIGRIPLDIRSICYYLL